MKLKIINLFKIILHYIKMYKNIHKNSKKQETYFFRKWFSIKSLDKIANDNTEAIVRRCPVKKDVLGELNVACIKQFELF